MKITPWLLTLATASLLLESEIQAAQIEVQNANDTSAGSLRQAIADAQAGDTITFHSSLAGQAIGLTSGHLLINKNLTIEGPGANLLAVDAGKLSRVLLIEAGAVTIRGLTLRNGRCAVGEAGGGILVFAGSLTLEECAITGNTVPKLNSAGGMLGGGVYFSVWTTLVARRCLFADNVVEDGGGGAVYLDGSATVTLENCTLARNEARQGGAIFLDHSGQLAMNSCTVTANKAVLEGGGAEFFNRPSLRNCIFAGNTAPQGADVVGGVTSEAHNLIGNTSNSSGWVATDLLNLDPLLGPLADNGGPTMTCALLPGSPAIDQGIYSLSLPIDQRGAGFARTVDFDDTLFPNATGGDGTDIGAFELAPCGAPVVTLTAPDAEAVYPVNTPVTFTATFDDENGPHTAQWNIDGNLVAANVDETTHTVSNTFSFADPGVYSVQLIVSNACVETTTTDTTDDGPASVVIYDPSAGYVRGHGWIRSPAGAYPPAPSWKGKAYFAFASQWKKGAKLSKGEAGFLFKAPGLLFSSKSYDWLVVNGANAQFKGVGKVNQASGFGFLLTAVDGKVNGSGGKDKFRIKIWHLASSKVVYDNQMGAGDSATPTAVVGGGNIQIKN